MNAMVPPPEEALASSFARLMSELHLRLGGKPEDSEALALAATLVSRAASEGQSALDLEALERGTSDPAAMLPRLRASPVVAEASDPDPFRPLVLSGNRLYLYRYFDYERRLASRLAALNRPLPYPSADATALLSRLFPPGQGPDWQKIAAATALLRGLLIVSGGPGTGKTTTVVKILALLLALAPGLRAVLAAPTGKAAARLKTSLEAQLGTLPPGLASRLPAEACTVHRLLGFRPGRVSFRHDREHPLPYGLVVVDEASMLDLALATKLTEAIPDHGRLILLGDKAQLSAVETGTVFADLSASRSVDPGTQRDIESLTGEPFPAPEAAESGGLGNAVVWLSRGHRYREGGEIGGLVERVRDGDAEGVLAWLSERAEAEVRWEQAPPGAERLAARLLDGYSEYLEAVRRGAPADSVLAAFERHRVLSALREGEHGTRRLNEALAERFRRALGEPGTGSGWYAGRPVLITANDYATRLFNGDVGVALPGPGGQLLVHFPEPGAGTRALSPGRLPEHETAFAMTVHKAQGSEFERAEVVLPARDSRVLSRELVYTALTRARRSLRLWARPSVLRAAIGRTASRSPSGLVRSEEPA